jgi:hypothetical protein
MLLRLSLALASFIAAPAYAHSGHGAVSEWHWHATDTSGFLMVAVLGALALWLSRGE